jgi:phosphatidate cytidylyltransferase
VPFFAAEISRQIVLAMVVLYAVLAVASIGVAIGTRSLVSSRLRLQVNAWWIIFPIVSLSLVLYPLGPLLLVCMIGIIALHELSSATMPQNGHFYIECLTILCLTVIFVLVAPKVVDLALPLIIAAQFFFYIQQKNPRHLPLFLFFILCYGLSFIIRLAHLSDASEANIAWLFFLFVVTALNDIGQFLAGTVFGRHKIAPRISPNKTWEGLAGGIFVSIAVAGILGTYLQLEVVGPLALYAILLSIGGFAGDLMFSAAKRRFNIKDFSSMIPGHGGILDRVDSLVLTAPLLYFALTLSH